MPWYKTELEGEDRTFSHTILTSQGHLRQANLSDVVSLGREAGLERLQLNRFGIVNLGAEVTIEPAETVLVVDRVHSNEVSRVNAITKKFDTHAWNHMGSLGINRPRDGKTHETSVGAAEHAGVRMLTDADPLDLGNATLTVDRLFTAGAVAHQLVAFRVENRCLIDDEGTGEVPAARLSVFSDLRPDLVRLRPA